ncbi:MAG: indole-3-glycerol phosphate synthase/phosphoribosylanthranilate isomerase, partial [Paraglaciecola sp.]
GTGRTFNWQLLHDRQLTAANKDKIILAGGINPQNIQEAARLALGGIDLNSGVESAPGIKSAIKIQQAFEQLRQY